MLSPALAYIVPLFLLTVLLKVDGQIGNYNKHKYYYNKLFHKYYYSKFLRVVHT